MKVLDDGHRYELATLDGGFPQVLTFVKRHSVEEPEKYPGNFESYPGTTLQNVLRALLNRVRYLNNQIWSVENTIILLFLKVSVWLLEFRASRRHGRLLLKSMKFTEEAPMCPRCGHTFCHHRKPDGSAFAEHRIEPPEPMDECEHGIPYRWPCEKCHD